MENYKLIETVKNELFNRTQIMATVVAKITPNHEEVEALLAKEFKTDAKNIKLKGINGKFGSNTFKITANIYASEEDKNKLEIKKKWETERIKKLEEAAKAKIQEEEKAKEEAIAAKEAEKAAKEEEKAKPEEESKEKEIEGDKE